MVKQFTLTLEDVAYGITVAGDRVEVNARSFDLAFEGDTITVNGTAHTVEVTGQQATVDGITYTFAVTGLEEERPAPRRGPVVEAGADEANVIRAIMPGLILRILVAEGDEVAAGDVVLILEAMKMENELLAKKSGVVKQLAVAPGDNVEMGQVLAVIEKSGGDIWTT